MPRKLWEDILLPPGNEDQLWELFHENSKIGRYSNMLSEQEIRTRMSEFHESLPFEGYPVVELPGSLTPLNLSLEKAIATRVSSRSMTPCPLTLEKLATLLHYAYGISRDNKGTAFPRPFRIAPSGGALYPLELFFHSAHIDSLWPGLYHYNPAKNHLRLLRQGDETRSIADAIVQPEIVLGASLVIFLTAVFERSIFKYGDRGYRFVLLEAGHVAQNLNLVANALALECVNLGGFFDRQVDDLLELDGLTHATIYIVVIGGKLEAPQETEKPI